MVKKRHGIENLKPVEKGEIRNPYGRAGKSGDGGLNRSTIVKKWLTAIEKIKNPITKQSENLTQQDILVLSMISSARKGNVSAYKALIDDAFGKLEESIKHQVSGVTQEEQLDIVNDIKKRISESE